MTRRLLAALALLLVLAAAPLANASPDKEKAHAPPGQEKADERAGKEKPHAPRGEAEGHAKRDEPTAPRASGPRPQETPAAPPQEAAQDEPQPAAAPTPEERLPEPAESRPLRAPTPIPERRVETMEQGLATESRAPIPFPNPYAPPQGDGDASLLSPWGWALPILGLVGLGAALASTRPASVEPAADPARGLRTFRVAPPTLEGMLRAGKDAVEGARFEEAVAWFTQAIKLHPRLAVAHFCLGVCLATMGRHDEAHAALGKAHRLDPREGAYRLELARAAARIGRHQEAMQQMAPLLRLLPDLAEHAGDDEAFAAMRDHPRWLAMLGRL